MKHFMANQRSLVSISELVSLLMAVLQADNVTKFRSTWLRRDDQTLPHSATAHLDIEILCLVLKTMAINAETAVTFAAHLEYLVIMNNRKEAVNSWNENFGVPW
jgi:hypothetical protein